MSFSVANEHASLPIAFRLYLPRIGRPMQFAGPEAGVPEDVVFKTKPQIALDQIRAARAEGVAEGGVLADGGYGINTAFRTALTGMGLTYVVGVQSSARLWPPGAGPLPPKAWTGQGRPPTLMRRDAQNQPQSAEQLAKSLPADAWRDVAWREGVDKTLHSRFAAVRVRPAHREYWRSQPYAEEWLLVEWPQEESAPTNTGSRPWRRIQPSRRSWKPPNCAGGSSATIRNSSGNWASITMKVEAGEAFTTTWRSASQPTDSWSPNEVCSPLRRQNPRHQNVSPIQRLSTPRIPQSAQNATSNRPSHASALERTPIIPYHIRRL